MTKPQKTVQEAPGDEGQMQPPPESLMEHYKPAGKLKGKKAIVTGGDSGIGRAVAIAFAKEGADVAIIYLDEDKDAFVTQYHVEKEGRECMLIPGDVGDENFCRDAISRVVSFFGHIDILVNNAAEQHVQESVEKITSQQLENTFRTNVFSMFYLVRAALEFMREGSAIINTTSVTAYRGSRHLLDYSASKGAIVAFTRSLSQMLEEKKIRVNAVAPGPIWTPLIPSSMDKEETEEFGEDTPMGRKGQPDEVAPCYVFLASEDASYMSGQVLHPNGGEIVNA